jgi:hypothetical protein
MAVAVVVIGVHTFTGQQQMRDLTVAQVHTYYVLAGTTPVLVHNVDACPIGSVGERAAELQGVLPAGSQGRVTMGVGEGVDASGATRRVVGTSEPNGYLRPGVRDAIASGEEVASGAGHAEANILDYMYRTELFQASRCG